MPDLPRKESRDVRWKRRNGEKEKKLDKERSGGGSKKETEG